MMEWKNPPAKVTILGGDQRMVHTANAFVRDGCTVTLWGQEKQPALSAKEAVRGAELIVLPIPLSRDGVHLNAPLTETLPTLDEICTALRPGQMVTAGAASPAFANAVRARGASILDYQASELFAIQNAHATAEGAIAIALSESPDLLAGASVAVLGFGRIGKQLTRLLLAMGAKVTLYARKKADLAYGKTMGCSVNPLSVAPDTLRDAGVIFNTIPMRLFQWDALSLPPDSIIIDLAPIYPPQDTPRLIRAPSLPAKYSPRSAGELIHDTIVDGIMERAWEVCT